ncbi:MAG: hypothetical protein ACYCQL_01430 [Acidithiobacillus sp.]
MLKTFVVFRRPARWTAGLILLPAVLLSGCAPSPLAPPAGGGPHPNMDAALMKSVLDIQQVTDNLRAAHSVAWRGVYQGFPMRDGVSPSNGHPPVPTVTASHPASGPLAQKMYVQWSGAANVLGQALAQKLGWRYQDKSGMGGQMDVSVYGRDESVLSILKTMAAQLPDSVSLSVTPGRITLNRAGN